MLDLPAFLDLAETIALLALLSVAYGEVLRRLPSPVAGRLILGALFGAAAVVAMLDSFQIVPGMFVDLRALPVAFAGAFLGPQGLAASLAVSGAARLVLGGAGVPAGLVVMAVAGGMGLLWAKLTQAQPRRGARAFMLLSVMISCHLIAAVLMPATAALQFLVEIAPAVVLLNVVGTVVVGAVIERERLRVAREVALDTDAATDPLTGLLNRRGFDRRVGSLLASRQPGAGWAVLMIDVDHFKRVNDNFGHAAGDAILKELGARISSDLRGRDVVARFGGEELVVFMPGISPKNADLVAERLRISVGRTPFEVRGHSLTVTASIGGHWRRGGVNISGALLGADAALYSAKAGGGTASRSTAPCRTAPQSRAGRITRWPPEPRPRTDDGLRSTLPSGVTLPLDRPAGRAAADAMRIAERASIA